MIAILYESTETDFTSNGLGGLPDCYDDDAHNVRNGAAEISFKYNVSGYHSDLITEGRIVLVQPEPNKDPQPYTIYRIVTSTDKQVLTVYANHFSYMLSSIPVKPFTAASATEAMAGLKTNALISHNFNFWTDVTTAGTFIVTEPTSTRNWLGGRTGSILDVFGGEYEWDRFTVKLHAQRGSDNGVTIRYGKNLKSLEQDRRIDAVYTGTVAYWIDNQTKACTIGNIAYITNHTDYPHERIFPYNASQEYQTAPTVDQLTARAASYNTANKIGEPTVSISIDFESLAQTDEYKNIAPLEKVSLCDIVHVVYETVGITASGKVNETHYSWTAEKYTGVVIGDAKSSLSEAVSKTVETTVIPKTTDFLQADRARATSLLTGAFGGHMVIGYNADDEPEETYWMDTGDTATATKVLRANYNGIGGSVNGINGPYGVSMTVDGYFNADYMTLGTLRAIDIRGVNIYGSTITFGDDTNYMSMSNSSQKLLFNSYGTYGMQINASKSYDVYANPISGDTSERYATLHALNEYSEDVSNVLCSSSVSNGVRYGYAQLYAWARNCPHAYVKAYSQDTGNANVELTAENNAQTYQAYILTSATTGIRINYKNPSIPSTTYQSYISLNTDGSIDLHATAVRVNGTQI